MTPDAYRKPKLLTLILLSSLAVLPVSMFPPSLPGIARAFEVDYGVVNLAIAGYAWAGAAVQLVMGPLSDRFGRRPVLLAALSTFTLASLGCATATGIWTFLGFRLLQAVVISGYSVPLAVIRDSWHEREAASVIGYVSVGWALAPMLGPVFGRAARWAVRLARELLGVRPSSASQCSPCAWSTFLRPTPPHRPPSGDSSRPSRAARSAAVLGRCPVHDLHDGGVLRLPERSTAGGEDALLRCRQRALASTWALARQASCWAASSPVGTQAATRRHRR